MVCFKFWSEKWQNQKQRVGVSFCGNINDLLCSFPSISCCHNLLQLGKSDPLYWGCKGNGKYKNTVLKICVRAGREGERCRKSEQLPAFPAYMVCLCWGNRIRFVRYERLCQVGPKESVQWGPHLL